MPEDDLLPAVTPRVQDGAVPAALIPTVTAGVALSCPEFGTVAAGSHLSLCPWSWSRAG